MYKYCELRCSNARDWGVRNLYFWNDTAKSGLLTEYDDVNVEDVLAQAMCLFAFEYLNNYWTDHHQHFSFGRCMHEDEVMSPHSEYLWKTLTYRSPECLTAPPHSEHRWTISVVPVTIIDSGHTNSFGWKSGSLIRISQTFHKMYRNDCRLTCWNQNFDIPKYFQSILERQRACQMNDRQIAAESQQIFIFCSLKLWSYCTDLHQNFIRCRGISVFTKRCCILFENSKAKSEDGQFWRLHKGPQQRLFNNCKNNFSFIICIHEPTNAEKVVKFGPVVAEIFGMICRFLPSCPKRYRNSPCDDLWG